MKKILLIFPFCILPLLFFACTEDYVSTSYVPSMSSTTYNSRINDKEISFEVRWGSVKDTPDWSHDKPLPFNLKKAIEIASGQFDKHNQDLKVWSLAGINLNKFGETDKWYYVITFERKPEDGSAGPSDDYLQIPVLFSGQAITSQ